MLLTSANFPPPEPRESNIKLETETLLSDDSDSNSDTRVRLSRDPTPESLKQQQKVQMKASNALKRHKSKMQKILFREARVKRFLSAKQEDLLEENLNLAPHSIETKNRGENKLFLAMRDCPGMLKFSKRPIQLEKKVRGQIRGFLRHLEDYYNFYLEHYVSVVPKEDYSRLLAVRDYLDHVYAEKNLPFLKNQDWLYLQTLSTYIFIERTFRGDQE